MATSSATFSLSSATMGLGRSSQTKRPTTTYIYGLNSFSGLKAQKGVATLGLSVCTQQSFANIVNSIRESSPPAGGGVASTTCNVAGDIFRIAATMNVLVLVGVAMGFVLLRVEAFVEEVEG